MIFHSPVKKITETIKIKFGRKHISIVPQLSKCLKFEAVWGVLTDQMI